MAVCNHRKSSSFEAKAQLVQNRIRAVRMIVTEIRHLVYQVAAIVTIIVLAVLGLADPDLLSAVTDAIAR